MLLPLPSKLLPSHVTKYDSNFVGSLKIEALANKLFD